MFATTPPSIRVPLAMGLLVIGTALSGCYSFKGYSIPETAKTYYVGTFKVNAFNAPPAINQTFTESLKDKVARESRLRYTDSEPDMEFNGAIQGFNVSAVAPQPGERTSFNRLTIIVQVEYTSKLDAKGSWSKSFSHFADFAADQNLLDVQDDLITIIFTQILEDVFNTAFNNW
jgi:hypothetical protein